MREESQDELFVVMSQYTGFMASDREPERKVYGPTTEAACKKYIEDARWGDGPGSQGPSLWVQAVKVHYEY